MLGAVIGDIVGSPKEFNNHRSKEFEMFTSKCSVTDDSIMTAAVAKAIMSCDGNWERLGEQAIRSMQEIGRKYPTCGYGGMFWEWMFTDDPLPYGSYGNGAAMRVSPCGFAARTESEAKLLSRKVTEVSHNHPEGIKGAEATTIAIFLAKNGSTKEEIGDRMRTDYYDLDFTLDSIRSTYKFNETCQETVPQAIKAFLESNSFEDTIRGAISIGGDSDTLAAIAGSIAEAYFGIPDKIRDIALSYLNPELKGIYDEWQKYMENKF